MAKQIPNSMILDEEIRKNCIPPDKDLRLKKQPSATNENKQIASIKILTD